MGLFRSRVPGIEEERIQLAADRKATEEARRTREQVQRETAKIAEVCMQIRRLRGAT